MALTAGSLYLGTATLAIIRVNKDDDDDDDDSEAHASLIGQKFPAFTSSRILAIAEAIFRQTQRQTFGAEKGLKWYTSASNSSAITSWFSFRQTRYGALLSAITNMAIWPSCVGFSQQPNTRMNSG